MAFRRFCPYLPGDVALLALRLPGRESRIAEAPSCSVDEVVAGALKGLRVYGDAPLVLYGHSLGATLAYELALALEAEGVAPRRVVVSSRCAPHKRPRRAPVHDKPVSSLLNELRSYGGTPEEFFNNEELQELLLPMLRADFRLAETYHRADPQQLRCELVAVAAEGDTLVSPSEVAEWRVLAGGKFVLHTLLGGHFFLFDEPGDILDIIIGGL